MRGVVYYLPGAGGRLAGGLGAALMARGCDLAGRETRDDFRRLLFEQQVQTIADDLQAHFWHDYAKVVAVSFGAYLFLHAQARLPAYPGQVLLLSPIVGGFSNDDLGMNFRPPHADRLQALAQSGQFTPPGRCHVHVGSLDWQSRPDDVQAFAALVGIKVTIAAGAGHTLGKDYVGPVLDAWLDQAWIR
jgi:hypothetical protein